MLRFARTGGNMLHRKEYPSSKLAWCSCALAASLFLLAPVASATSPGPTDVIRQFYAELQNVMQHAAQLGAKGRYQKLEPIVHRLFDVPYMAKLSIGPSWAKLAADQKRRAAQAYGRYITALYTTRFDGYSGERFEVLGEQEIKHATMIKTRIVKSNGEPVSINFMMHDNDIAWQARDVYLDSAISELATRRSEFAQVLRTSGIDALINSLNKKADELQI
jgi:phospholipid transport system substrate-binding protein